jgi:ABC-type bacteriocin/lantibiotic exporter with double-glycine peptidase domain
MRRLGAGAALAAVSLALGVNLWLRWGPAPQRAVPPAARVRQWSQVSCGPAAVATLLNVWGRPWERRRLEAACGLAPTGASMLGLREALRTHGLRAEGVRAARPAALDRAPCPFIAHLSRGHYVVVERRTPAGLSVFDPSSGRSRLWSREELFRAGGGHLLIVKG